MLPAHCTGNRDAVDNNNKSTDTSSNRHAVYVYISLHRSSNIKCVEHNVKNGLFSNKKLFEYVVLNRIYSNTFEVEHLQVMLPSSLVSKNIFSYTPVPFDLWNTKWPFEHNSKLRWCGSDINYIFIKKIILNNYFHLTCNRGYIWNNIHIFYWILLIRFFTNSYRCDSLVITLFTWIFFSCSKKF